MAVPPLEFCLEKEPVLLEAFLWTVDVKQGERKPLIGTFRINKSLSFQCEKSPGQTLEYLRKEIPASLSQGLQSMHPGHVEKQGHVAMGFIVGFNIDWNKAEYGSSLLSQLPLFTSP